MAEKVSFEEGKLQVPDKPVIPYIEGDGVGQDIWKNAQIVFDKAIAKVYGGHKQVIWREVLAGKKA
jgi:isocitrate dehydrogenase